MFCACKKLTALQRNINYYISIEKQNSQEVVYVNSFPQVRFGEIYFVCIVEENVNGLQKKYSLHYFFCCLMQMCKQLLHPFSNYYRR
jgi:hypothetical protein